MTHILRKTVLALVLATAVFSGAEAQKIAHVNMDSLLSAMPETKTAATAAEAISNSLNQEMMAMQSEFEAKYKDYLEKEPTMSDLLKKTKQEDLRQLEQRTADFRTQAQQEYQIKTGELTKPIMEKAKKAVAAVAKEGGYKYVLDTSPQNTPVLYSDPADDIMGAVKKKLDTMPLATIPGATNAEAPKTPPAPAGGDKPAVPKK
jgi:outer membrane protein